MLYASRTLLQMLALSPQGAVPRGIVTDFPETRRRMLMLDVARKPFPLPVLKDYIRLLAWNRMNELHLHFSDVAGGDYSAFRIESKKFPGLHSQDLFYSQAELRDLQDFAKARGVVITPEIDMPGHARPMTHYWPELRNPKLPAYNLDVTNPKSAQTMKALLDEMIPLFDAPDFHIGTDEYHMGNLPDADKKAVGEAFRKFINEMNAHVRSKGKNCRIWSGWSHMPGSTEPDPSVVIDMWLGNNAKELTGKGHSVISSSDQGTYLVPGAHYYGVNEAAIYERWSPWKFGGKNLDLDKDDPKLLGGKLHVWMDEGPAGYTMQEIAATTYPPLRVFAEKMWGVKGSKDLKAFKARARATDRVPGVDVFDRMPGSSRDHGVFFARPEETVLANANSMVPLPWQIAQRADLEYPWTLRMQVKKTAETGGRGVILSSELMEICADFKNSVQRKTNAKDAAGQPVLENVELRGVGLVRAMGAFGKDPAAASNAWEAWSVCSEPLPVNAWVDLVIVAERGKTTVYLDGLKTGETDNQTVCPLRQLGSRTGNSFVGSIRNLLVYDRAFSAKEVARTAGKWVAEDIAAGCKVTASASDRAAYLSPDHLTDNDPATRWSSGPTGAEQQVIIDLGAVKTFDKVAIKWENAFPREYAVAASNDGSAWKEAGTGEGSAGDTECRFAKTSGRFVRITMRKPATGWGYSAWNMAVYEAAP